LHGFVRPPPPPKGVTLEESGQQAALRPSGGGGLQSARMSFAAQAAIGRGGVTSHTNRDWLEIFDEHEQG
jgi:hypothetical protein